MSIFYNVIVDVENGHIKALKWVEKRTQDGNAMRLDDLRAIVEWASAELVVDGGQKNITLEVAPIKPATDDKPAGRKRGRPRKS